MTVIFIPALTLLLLTIHRHYKRVARVVEQPARIAGSEMFATPRR